MSAALGISEDHVRTTSTRPKMRNPARFSSFEASWSWKADSVFRLSSGWVWDAGGHGLYYIIRMGSVVGGLECLECITYMRPFVDESGAIVSSN